MKPRPILFHPVARTLARGLSAGALGIILIHPAAHAASDSWIVGTNGDYTTPANWTGGNVPNGATDVATVEGAGSVVAFNSTVSLQNLNLALSTSGQTPTFDQSGGTLSIGTLGFGGGGASRNPTYNMNGGALNIATAFTWGSGSNARFNQSAGTVNHSGGSLSIGVAGGARGYITMTGGTFNANSVAQVNLANTGSGNGQAYIDLSGESVFNATASTFVIGQFGAATGTSAFATVTLADTAELNTSTVVVGGNNAGSAVYGVINLNGGTISAGSIRKGSSSIASSATQNVLHANGGTVKALFHSNNVNYFQGLFVDLQTGGLKFDTNGNDVTIATPMSGDGGLTKQGDGNLTLSALNSYTGNTTVSGGTLTMPNVSLDDASTASIASGAKLNLTHAGQDEVAKIVLDGVEHTTPGTYGSSASGAIFQNDTFFEGDGVLRIGPLSPGRSLVWTGADSAYWDSNGGSKFGEYNFTDGANPAEFLYNDSVTFDDSSTVTNISMTGMLYPGTVTFNGTQDYIVQSPATPSGIGGTADIVVNNTASVSLGGADSVFTGTITVNAGKLIALDNKSFGASSGITIAGGAQVDLNGRAPGSIYTYTLNGPGPDGGAAIVNSGADVFSATGIKNLILNADSTIGNDVGRFDIGHLGTITGNGHTLTKIGNNGMAVRGDASGSEIHYVIAGGHAWAENTANAFGGASGSVQVLSGAAVGHFGAAMTIATPVTIGNGGILRSGTFPDTSTNTGTWTGNLSMTGEVTLDAVGGPIDLTGTIAGTANVTKTGGNTVTILNPTYVGDTTVSTGTLNIGTAALYDGATLRVESGAILNLTHSGTDVVDGLVLGGVAMAPGTYGSSASTAEHKDDTYFQGTGVLDVQNLAVITTGFAEWIGGYPLAGADALPDADPDNDGVSNAVEYVLGGDPTVPSQAGLPSGSAIGDNLVFSFPREDDSETADILLEVQYGNDLSGWTSVTIGAASAGIVTIEENDAAPDLVTVTIPKDGDPAKFARLKVTVATD